MITAARPSLEASGANWYWPDGRLCLGVPCKSRPGELRKATVADARKLNLLARVTTVTRVLHRHLLVQWLIEQAVLAVLSSPKREDETLDQFVERILQVEKHQDQERDQAAQRGKEIHKALTLAMDSGILLGECYDFIKEPVEFLRKIGRCVATEKTVVGDGYAGTLDLLLQNDSELWIVDYKSCRKLPDEQYDENRLQLGAYAGALGNVGDLRIRCANLYINTTEPGQWKIIESKDWQADYERFLLLARFFRLTNNLP